MITMRSFFCSDRCKCFGAARLLVFLAVAVILWPQCATGQHPAVPKLTLAQVEELVSHGVPDSTMSTQVQRRGLAFVPTPAIVESLRAKGAGPLTVAAIQALLPKATPHAQSSTAVPVAKNGGSKRRPPTATHIQIRVGRLEIHTEPGSQVSLDDKAEGTAGADGLIVLQDVVEGDHELVARKDGYREASSKFTLSNNEDKQLSLPIEWAGGFLSVSAQPGGARIHVDGPQSLDGNITDVKSKPGSYSVAVSSDGYITQTRNFQIGVGEHHVEKFQLEMDPAAAKVKADAGDAASLEILKQAVARGEEISTRIKFNPLPSVSQYTGFYCYNGPVPTCADPSDPAVNLSSGVLTLSKATFAFSGSCRINRGFGRFENCDFQVSPDKVLVLENQPQWASRVHVQVAIRNKKGDKEDKKNYYFYNAGATPTGAGALGGAGTSISCNGCDDSMNVLFVLLEMVRGMK